jgi:hypothetical protein
MESVMSKQSEAKEAQNYRKQSMSCMNCAQFSSEMVGRKPKWASSPNYVITEEKNLRCGLGDFKVQKTGSCDRFSAKATTTPESS